MKTINLPIFGIVVTLTNDGGGSISTTDLQTKHKDVEDELYNASMNGIESLILAHACAGVDITTKEYIIGIETAVHGCANNY